MNRQLDTTKVVVYITTFVADILSAYKIINHLNGFKIPKLKFGNELENEIVKELTRMCGGNP